MLTLTSIVFHSLLFLLLDCCLRCLLAYCKESRRFPCFVTRASLVDHPLPFKVHTEEMVPQIKENIGNSLSIEERTTGELSSEENEDDAVAEGITAPAEPPVSANGVGSLRAPAARLPAEILSEIFRLVQPEKSDRRDSNGWYWIVVTHVCRQWRDVAVNTQDLWTYIKTSKHANIEQTAAYLKRSGTSQLVLCHDYTESNTDSLQYLNVALRHLYRVNDLNMHIPSDISVEIKRTISQNAAPVLQTLRLVYSDSSFDADSLFNGIAPKLQNLLLIINSQSNSQIIRGLRNLYLSNWRHLDTQEMLHMLLENQDLETLRVSCPLQGSTQDTTLPGPPSLRLHRLKSLDLSHGDHKAYASLFKNIVFPSGMNFTIHCSDSDFENANEHARDLLPYIPNDDEDINILSLHYRQGSVRISGTSEDGKTIRRSLYLSWDNEGDIEPEIDTRRWFSFACSTVVGGTWSFITELNLEIEVKIARGADVPRPEYLLAIESLGKHPWEELLRVIPNVRNLSIKCIAKPGLFSKTTMKQSHLGFLGALEEIARNENGKLQFICPNLFDLELYGMDFEFGWQSLVRVLKQRALCGIRLRKLRISEPFNCTGTIKKELKGSGIARKVEFPKE